MTEQHVSATQTILEIVEAYPATLDIFIANGFSQFEDANKLKSIGKILKLESALKTKSYDLNTYINMLEERINDNSLSADITLKEKVDRENDIEVIGLLPCPVRIPLLEGFDKFNEAYQKKTGLSVGYKLEAASVGAEWIEKNISTIENAEDLPDLFISAGFETFFDKKTIGKFKENNVFKDITSFEISKDFEGTDIVDPQGHYSIISVVPSVFMVNLQELGDIPVPRTWADILKPEFEQKVALPVGDFDLFNAILVNIYKDFGAEGIEKMGRSLLKSMHPSQMVKNAKKAQAEKPAVTIMPYFFTRMMHGVKTMEIVWPEDGAIISPIFMLAKSEKEKELKEIADFFSSKDVGEILSHKGLFPSLNAEVENPLPENAPFKWVGWDYIYSNDIGELIRTTNEIFEATSLKVKA